jgi:hypothetical protein
VINTVLEIPKVVAVPVVETLALITDRAPDRPTIKFTVEAKEGSLITDCSDSQI